ncbi:MAG: hypothetical protein Q8O56_05330 [Solirubrobacteraceae bacterium]|nr:hypothetical protein [Solirubrobacteraceae bacterium]
MNVPDKPIKQQTWNDARAIAEHRRMSSAECLPAAISLAQIALLRGHDTKRAHRR